MKNSKSRTALRKQYQSMAGRSADKRWGVARLQTEIKSLAPVDNRGGWWPIIREFAPGSWQTNVEVSLEDSLRYWAVFRCISIIASDIGKMRLKLVERDGNGIWQETTSAAFSPVLRKPNTFQTRIQFFENWMTSKLSRGNTYVLKRRDARGVVTGLYILDPNKVTPLVSDNGDVFYRLNRDNVSGIETDAPAVPASEIIHDRWNCLYHPLVGLSPIYAIGINALAGLKAESMSARFFNNGARPSAVLEAPAAITDATAQRIKAYWEENFTGENAGKVAVLGDGLKYQQMTMSAVDAQLIEQLRWNDATIAGAFGVPTHMINGAATPSTTNVEAVNQLYYSQCLQIHLESIELLIDEGLGLDQVTGRMLGSEFDLHDLLRMDTATKVRTASEGVRGGLFKPNEARAWFDLEPVTGGDAVYLQQQNYSLPALAKRDAKDDPFSSSSPAPALPAPAGDAEIDEPDELEADNDNIAAESQRALAVFRTGLAA